MLPVVPRAILCKSNVRVCPIFKPKHPEPLPIVELAQFYPVNSTIIRAIYLRKRIVPFAS